MKMSAAYLQQTAEFLTSNGFALTRHAAPQLADSACNFTRYTLTRSPAETLVLEVVHHPTEGERYYLQLVAFHGLRSFSFPLDSWKFKGTQLELKFYSLPDSGLGLSLTLDVAQGGTPH